MTAIQVLLDNHVPQNQIIFVNLISCPEGLDALTTKYPEVKVVTAECDSHLNDKKYIIPGCGDFGGDSRPIRVFWGDVPPCAVRARRCG